MEHWNITGKRTKFTPFMDGYAAAFLLIPIVFFGFVIKALGLFGLLVYLGCCLIIFVTLGIFNVNIPMRWRRLRSILAGDKRPARTYRRSFL